MRPQSILLRPPLLNQAELQVLDQIDDLRRKLRFALSTPTRWEGLLRRATFAKSELNDGGCGMQLDAASTHKGESVEFDGNAAPAAVGYRRATKYILRLSGDPFFKYSSELLRCLHYMMLEHDPEESPGQWRTGDFFVRDRMKNAIVHYGPDPDKVPGLVDELMSCLNSSHPANHNVVCAAMAHLNLALIHPFRDGNGRIARALQTLVLARSGVIDPDFSSIEEYLGRNRVEYEAVLAAVRGDRWDPRSDTRPWIRFCLTAHYRQATTLLRRVERIRAVWDRVEQEVTKRRLPERAMLALVDATLGYPVRNATYRSAAGISEYLASRDLKTLVRAGLLVAQGDRRGRFYLPADSLKSIRVATKPEKASEDPLLTIESSR